MDGHNHNNNNNMPGMSPTETQSMEMVMGHMTFFWGKNGEILFSGWPGTRTGMYVLALILVFLLSVLLEWLSSYCNKIQHYSNGKGGDGSSSSPSPSSSWSTLGVILILLHGVRTGVSYLVMLAVMSFNVGVLIVAVTGHTVGFLFFGRKKTPSSSSGHC